MLPTPELCPGIVWESTGCSRPKTIPDRAVVTIKRTDN